MNTFAANAAIAAKEAIQAQPDTFLSRALPLIARNVPVIPLKPKTKIAIESKWPELASTDVAKIEAWQQQYPDANCGAVALAKPDGTCFWETDSPEAVLRMERETGHKLPDTFRARSSPGKGHNYFKQTPATIKAGNIAQGYVIGGDWSLRVSNQYVVAPKSVHPITGLPYEVISDAPIIDAPDWLIEWLVSQKIEKPKLAAVPSESSGKIELVPDAPVLEGGRNTRIASEAGTLWEQGQSQPEIQQAMLDLNAKWCVPPLSDKEVLTTVASICNLYEQGKPTGKILFDGLERQHQNYSDSDSGVDFLKITPELQALPVGKSAVRPFEELADTSDPAKRSWVFEHLRVTADELSDKPQSWLLNEMLLEHGLHLFSGKAGSMKSMLALMLAKATATGEPFLLRENIGHQTNVIYIDRENPESEQRKRCAALGLLHLPNFRIWGDWREEWPPPLGFDDPRLIESAKRDKPLFIFDSLSSYLNGEDENGTAEMMQIMGKARSLARMSAGVIILHHTPKNGPPSARGNTAITASTDMAFIVSKEGRKVTLKEDRFRPCGSYVMGFEMDFGGITGVYNANLVMDTARSIVEPPSQLEQMKAKDRQATEESTRQHHIDAAKAIIERQYALGEPVRSRAALCGLMGVNPTGRFAKENLNGCEDNPWTCVLNKRSLAFLPKGVTKMPEPTLELAGEMVH